MVNFFKYAAESGGSVKLLDAQEPGSRGMFNPSIINKDGKLYMSFRSGEYTFLNYLEKQPPVNNLISWYPLQIYSEVPANFVSYNYICEIDKQSFTVKNVKRIFTNLETRKNFYNGAEDIRLFFDKDNNVRAAYSLYEDSGKISMNFDTMDSDFNVTNHVSYSPEQYEKNWMPVIDRPDTFIRKPFEDIVTEKDHARAIIHTSKNADLNERGSTQLIQINNEYICIVHRRMQYGDKIQYEHRFVMTDNDFHVIKTSQWFVFAGLPIEFTCGMCILEQDLIIPVSVFDSATFIIKIGINEVMDFIDEKEGVVKHSFGDTGNILLMELLSDIKSEKIPMAIDEYVIRSIPHNKAAMIACRTHFASLLSQTKKKSLELYVQALCDIKKFDTGMGNKYTHMLIGQDLIRDCIEKLI